MKGLRLLLDVFAVRFGRFRESCRASLVEKKDAIAGFLVSLAGFFYWWGYKKFKLALSGYCIGSMVDILRPSSGYRTYNQSGAIIAVIPSDKPIVVRCGVGYDNFHTRELRLLFVASRNAADYREAELFKDSSKRDKRKYCDYGYRELFKCRSL